MIARVLAAYSGLGRRPAGMPEAFAHFHCPRWRNPVMSPVWPRKGSVTPAELRRLERYFALRPRRHDYDAASRCYLNVLAGPEGHALAAIGRAAALEGWQRQDRGTLNVWLEPGGLALPPGYSLRSARLGASPIHRDFLDLTRRNFKSSARFMRELRAMFPAVAPRTFEVVLYGRSGAPAAAGLVTTGRGAAYFFCDSVEPRHRGRGLWRSLVAARQWLSRADGADFWVASTVNPRIAGKCDRAFRIVTFSKAG